jgi:hypothetical protein
MGLVAPPDLVSRALVSLGHERVLEPVFARLLAGEPVTVVALGSSITARAGGCTHSIVTGESGGCCGATCTSRSAGFLRSFFDQLNGSFPHTKHRLFNAGVPASTPATFVECLETWLPREADSGKAAVDMFIVEFVAVKDIALLLTRLRTVRTMHPPAIIVVGFYRWIHQMPASHVRLLRTALRAGLPVLSQRYAIRTLYCTHECEWRRQSS